MSPIGGPAVVAVGGGHGLAATLRAARHYAGTITAVVSVADDGGSSGRLRATLGVAPVGDLRHCLSALAADGSLLGSSLEYRFPAGDLEGHALGNLVLAGLAATAGDLVVALDEVARLTGCAGRVLPAASEPVVLTAAVVAGGRAVEGQVAIENTTGVTRIALRPEDVATPPAVVDAIATADQVVIGPGSLFTSVLAAAVVPGVRRALHDTAARKVYVSNLRPQQPETGGFTVADHVDALLAHGVPVDLVLCQPGALPAGDLAVPAVERQVAGPGRAVHDPVLLGLALADLG